MSIISNYYVIAGYDLTGMKTDKFNDWEWTEESEEYTHYQKKGNIQLFTDPMNGSHLYLGYILAAGTMYELKTSKFTIEDANVLYNDVKTELIKLIEKGVITDASYFTPKYQIIVFEECS